MLIRGAEIGGLAGLDLRTEGERIAEIGAGLAPRRGEDAIDARGGALLPGLWDHHLHLLALAAAEDSIRCGPPRVRDATDLERALDRPGGGWLRGVGYCEAVAGRLDRRRLDALGPARPLRIQHRSGGAWVLNSRALAELGLERGPGPDGVERDAGGHPTGVLYGLDTWLRERLPPAPAPDLARVGRRLARCGVTGATDATPGNAAAELAILEDASRKGDLPQSLHLMGGPDLPEPRAPGVSRGPLKLVLRERALPDLDELVGRVAAAHAAGRAAAIHCVTRAEVLLATAVFEAAGPRPGDRLEHASVAPPPALARVAALGLSVVTQPGFLHERGDDYVRDVEPRDRPWLYRGQGFLAAGVPLGAGSDAPFGEPDPWLAMRAAVRRESAGGRVLGPHERLSPEQALALFTAPADAPGAEPRRLRVGALADLCLLERPWREARRRLCRGDVVATVARGRLLWRAPAW